MKALLNLSTAEFSDSAAVNRVLFFHNKYLIANFVAINPDELGN